MMATYFDPILDVFGLPAWLLIIVVVWTLAWKGVALWKSARNSHPIWFVAFLLIHTVGILEILYIFLFSKMKLPELEEKKKKRRK